MTKNQARWRVGVGEIAGRVGGFWQPSFMGIKPDQNWIDDDDEHSFKIVPSCLNSIQKYILVKKKKI